MTYQSPGARRRAAFSSATGSAQLVGDLRGRSAVVTVLGLVGRPLAVVHDSRSAADVVVGCRLGETRSRPGLVVSFSGVLTGALASSRHSHLRTPTVAVARLTEQPGDALDERQIEPADERHHEDHEHQHDGWCR